MDSKKLSVRLETILQRYVGLYPEAWIAEIEELRMMEEQIAAACTREEMLRAIIDLQRVALAATGAKLEAEDRE